MCWACYTPLSGAATVSAGTTSAATSASHAATGEEGEKKAIPPWQLGIIGVGLLLAIGIGVRSMMPASSSGDEGTSIDIPVQDPGPVGEAPAPASPPSSSTPNMSPGSGQVPPVEAPFKILLPPNPRLSVATMAIIPTQSGVSGAMAASYAAYARRQYGGQAKNWNTLYIYVFSDAQSAQAFAKVMRRRRGATLTDSDYSSLSSLWSSALVRYEYSTRGGRNAERVLYPSKNPSGWWYGR